MKKALSLFLALLCFSVSVLGDDQVIKVKDQALDKAKLNADYKGFFLAIPFDILPLTKDERAAEVKSKRFELTKDGQQKVNGFKWFAKDGTLRIRFSKLHLNNNEAMFMVKRKDGNRMPSQMYMLYTQGDEWHYSVPKNGEK